MIIGILKEFLHAYNINKVLLKHVVYDIYGKNYLIHCRKVRIKCQHNFKSIQNLSCIIDIKDLTNEFKQYILGNVDPIYVYELGKHFNNYYSD